MASKLTRRGLRAMRDRWQRDLARIEAEFPGVDLTEDLTPEAETIRNLATAIAEIRGIISNTSPFKDRHPAGSTALEDKP